MLYVPGGANSFNKVQSNNSGRPTTTQGTTVTPAVGSKGSWAEAIPSLDADTFGLLICINGNNVSAGSRNSVVDIGIGAAGSEVVLVPDLIGGNAMTYIQNGGGLWYFFPVRIPAGTRVAVRAQGTVVTDFHVFIQAFQQPADPSQVKAAAKIEAIGMTAPQGTSVAPNTTGEGTWTLLGATTRENWFWQLGAQVQSSDTTHNNNAVHVDLAEGDGTNFRVIMDSVLLSTNTTEGGVLVPQFINCAKRVPAGRNIYARAQVSNAVDNLYVCAYGAGG